MTALLRRIKCPNGFVPISIAAAKLQLSMFGNLLQTEPIKKIKKNQRGLRLVFEEQRREARIQIRKAAGVGELIIHAILADPHEPQVVYPEILACIMCVQGGLPDHVGRLVSFKKLVPANRALYFGIRDSILAVSEHEFERWRRRKSNEGKWPSQRSRKEKKKQRGRPRVNDNDLRTQIQVCLRDNRWTGRDGIPALRKILVSILGSINVTSEDTLARIVRALYVETGDSGLRTKSRRPRKATKS